MPLRKNRAGGETPVSVVQIIDVDRQPAWSSNGEIKIAMPALDLPVSRTVSRSTIHRAFVDARARRVPRPGGVVMPPALAMLDSVSGGDGGGVGAGSGAGVGPGAFRARGGREPRRSRR